MTEKNWLEDSIKKKHIKVYHYREFVDIKPNGEGRFSKVTSAEWNYTNRRVAIKKLKSYELEKFEYEVKLHCIAHSSRNIIRFLGLTKENQSNDKFSMVLEFADMNNLRTFLRRGVNLSWDAKVKLALDVANGLNYLHHRNIVHSDLHSNNIVVNQIHPCKQPEFIAKITDFGAAKENENDVAGIMGQIPFTDPNFLNDPRNYKKNFKSDIYSLGVVFWEISAERIPFENYMPESRGDFRDLCLTMEIINNFREEPVDATPEGYVKLYKKCWNLNNRPGIIAVIQSLKEINSGLKKTLEQTITTGE